MHSYVLSLLLLSDAVSAIRSDISGARAFSGLIGSTVDTNHVISSQYGRGAESSFQQSKENSKPYLHLDDHAVRTFEDAWSVCVGSPDDEADAAQLENVITSMGLSTTLPLPSMLIKEANPDKNAITLKQFLALLDPAIKDWEVAWSLFVTSPDHEADAAQLERVITSMGLIAKLPFPAVLIKKANPGKATITFEQFLAFLREEDEKEETRREHDAEELRVLKDRAVAMFSLSPKLHLQGLKEILGKFVADDKDVEKIFRLIPQQERCSRLKSEKCITKAGFDEWVARYLESE